jgi:polynucleotide 5'-hydroxyl-kinase GRC3/NOL9
MRQNVERGKTILIDGPACVALYSGTLRAFGAQIKAGEHLIVRIGRRIPLEAIEDSQVEILLGKSASCNIIDEDPIPSSWKNAAEKILSSNGRVEVIVLGGIDSGKTSFCIYLANMALNSGRKVALIDGDLGQSDIGPPGTLGLSIIRKPFFDPFNLNPDHMIFIGVTSPYNVTERIIDGLVKLRSKALSMGSDFIIINTDGWIEGSDAIDYKCRLIKNLEPKFTVIIWNNESMKPMMDLLTNTGTKIEILTVNVPKNIRKRDREMRKVIRETLYKKYLKDGKVRSIPLSWIKINGNLEIKGKIDQALKKKVEEIVGNKLLYCENLQDNVILVLKEGVSLSNEESARLATELNKPIKIICEGDEKGLIVALENSEGEMLGIGIICNIDFERGTLKIYTNVEETISGVHIGQIRLNEKGNEIEIVGKSSKVPLKDITY